MAEQVNTNQFKNGMHISLEGQVWRIVEFQHVKPGKGGAFVRTKLKALESGSTVDKTFRAGEKFPRVHTEVKNVQFLYDDGGDAHFMDEETYDQFTLPRADIATELAYMLPSSTVQILQVNGKPSGIQLPASVELAVAETEPEPRLLSFVRTNAPPLPGLTCWNSTIRHTCPSSSTCMPFLNWLVETTSAIGGPV